MIAASTFLSHKSDDKPLVEAVARELGRRGVVVWLDKYKLRAGVDLTGALADAVGSQAMTTVFLSDKAVKSDWVKDELAAALEQQRELGDDLIIPVFIGDPAALVMSHPMLRSRWMRADGKGVKMNGVIVDPAADADAVAQRVAEAIAERIFDKLKFRTRREVILHLEQRTEMDAVPESYLDLDAPMLVYRPGLDMRQRDETLHGEEWNQVSQAMLWTLRKTLGEGRWGEPKKLYVCGHAQSAMSFLIGRHFNRNTMADLFCTNMDGRTFTNEGQSRIAPLDGGNAHCQTAHPDLPAIAAGSNQESIALLLAGANYVAPVRRYLASRLASRPDSLPLVWVENGVFESSAQVMGYIADVVALLKRLRAEHQTRTVCLFNGLPFHVVPLLAANLLYVVENIVFLEYRRDLEGKGARVEDMYVELPF